MGSFHWKGFSLHFRLTIGMVLMLAFLFAAGLLGITSLSESTSTMQEVASTPRKSQMVDQMVGEARLEEDNLTKIIGGLLGLGVLTLAVISAFVARSIRRPLKELRIGAEAFAEGDLSYRIPILRRDELGEALQMFNEMARALEGGQEDLEHQAFHDTLTGLPNRSLFHDRLAHALARQERDRKPLAVLLVDLDDFKTVNDSLGHAAGDELLRYVSAALSSVLRPADTAARLGGDEFAVLVEDMRGRRDALRVADRIIEALTDRIMIENKEVVVHGSVGIAITYGQESADEVLRNADVAMYSAKNQGKGRYQVFDGAMHEGVMERLDLKTSLQRALEGNEFVVYYQPLFDLATGRVSSAEALLRWDHPEKGLILPDEFIALAEETGLILEIGRFVLEEACRQLSWWQMNFDADFGMSVNLSGRQLKEPDIVEGVQAGLAAGPVAGSSLTLELTESVLMDDTQGTVTKLNELRSLGVHLAIDDFGTGYSSLGYLRSFPIETIKIDRSFTQGVDKGPEESALARAVIKLAETLGMSSVAEGVETQAQVEELTNLGCTRGQGFVFAPALPPDELEAILARQRPADSAHDTISLDL